MELHFQADPRVLRVKDIFSSQVVYVVLNSGMKDIIFQIKNKLSFFLNEPALGESKKGRWV